MTNAEIIAELDKIIATLKGEEKKTRKLHEILADAYNNDSYQTGVSTCKIMAKFAIDAVIECYEEWKTSGAIDRPFPEYLKEKLL